MKFKTPERRFHRIDGWRGYYVPALAIIGASDTGMGYGSPCPSNEVTAEIQRFQDECLIPMGIKSSIRYGTTSNVFCIKRWLVVPEESFGIAAEAAINWIDEHDRDTHYIHTADLEQLIEKEG